MSGQNDYRRYKLIGHGDCSDFVILPFLFKATTDELRVNNSKKSVLVCGGSQSSFSLYRLSETDQFENLGKLAGFVREQVTYAITKTVGTALFTLLGGVVTSELEKEDSYLPLQSYADFQDSRRITRVWLDAGGRYVAAADDLGRVLLLDGRTFAVIRLWKGVRDGQAAFCDTCNDFRHHMLAIYAPRTGLLSIWRLRHGPCTHTLAVGKNCSLLSVSERFCERNRYSSVANISLLLHILYQLFAQATQNSSGNSERRRV